MSIGQGLAAITAALAMGQPWQMAPYPRPWGCDGYYARRSPKKRAILRARTGRK